MKVQRTEGSNRFCVPAALSALTGRTVDEITVLIHDEVGDQPIRGLFYPLALKILKRLGYTWKETNFTQLDGVVRNSAGKLFMVCFQGHMAVVDNFTYFDNSYPHGLQSNYPVQRLPAIGYHKIEKCFQIFFPEDSK